MPISLKQLCQSLGQMNKKTGLKILSLLLKNSMRLSRVDAGSPTNALFLLLLKVRLTIWLLVPLVPNKVLPEFSSWQMQTRNTSFLAMMGSSKVVDCTSLTNPSTLSLTTSNWHLWTFRQPSFRKIFRMLRPISKKSQNPNTQSSQSSLKLTTRKSLPSLSPLIKITNSIWLWPWIELKTPIKLQKNNSPLINGRRSETSHWCQASSSLQRSASTRVVTLIVNFSFTHHVVILTIWEGLQMPPKPTESTMSLSKLHI